MTDKSNTDYIYRSMATALGANIDACTSKSDFILIVKELSRIADLMGSDEEDKPIEPEVASDGHFKYIYENKGMLAAIKEYRAVKNVGLKAAKSVIHNAAEEYGWTRKNNLKAK